MLLPRPLSASELAARVGAALHGPDHVVTEVAPADLAGPDTLAFVDRIGAPCAAGVRLARAPVPDATTIVVADPLGALCDLLEALLPEPRWESVDVDPTAVVASGAQLAPGVRIGAGCVVGEGCVLFPNVVLYPRTRLGRGVRVHAGTVIGADGFRVHLGARGPRRVPHVAGVVVEDGVEIGANCTIDRGFLADTRIGAGSRLDAQVHVGHNVELGRGVLIAAQTGISGSVRIGDHAVLGGQVGIADHLTIGGGARIAAKSGVIGDVPEGTTVLGYPALPLWETRRMWAALRHLPEIVRRSPFGRRRATAGDRASED
jgi:UDP-3-O-[3-hydroxymyristoyl] glucosamine N-acyltransferase